MPDELDSDNDATSPPASPVAPVYIARSDPKLIRTNEDFKGDVRGWCDPKTRDNVTTLARCGHISDWNTTQVKSCSNLFKDQAEFNDDISRWDTSNVTDMSYSGCTSFNQPI